MAIIMTNNHIFFNNKQHAVVFFKDDSNYENYTIKQDGDFILILSNNKVVGINIFNYQNYFNVKEGYHKINDEQKQYLLNKFNSYLKEEDFDDFYKIGKVNKIKQHSSSDKLKILNVEFKNENKQIITNVQTLEEGKNYLFATNGSITYSGLRIIDSKVMNVKSEGMIMSYKSLGINKDEIIDCSNMSINDEYIF